MKKTLVIIALMVMTITQAQEGRKGETGERMKEATSQEMATMQSKKLTLALDLSDKQESEVYQVLFTQAKKRKANKISKEDRKQLTEEQKKAHKLAMINEKIAVKRSMKNILNKEQYAKWEKSLQKRKNNRGKADKRKDRRD